MQNPAPEVNFLTFHTGRCGSTVMSNLLNKHEGVVNEGEIYAQSYKRFSNSGRQGTPLEFLQFRMQTEHQRNRVYGCEVKLFRGTQLEEIGIPIPQAVKTFQNEGITKFILLHRLNHLDRLISQLVAVHRKEYVLREGEQADIPQFEINVNALRVGRGKFTLLDAIEAFDEDQNMMRETLQRDCEDFLELVYEEDIQNDPNVAVEKLANYVGFDFQRREPELRKVVQQPKESFISNYEVVTQTLEGTPYEWMLG